MSSKYKFEVTGYRQDEKIEWKLTSRLGCVWIGTFEIEGVTEDGKVHFDINTESPTNTPIPYRGMTLMKHHLRKLLIDAIIQGLKEYRAS